jgi:hypothetical protein
MVMSKFSQVGIATDHFIPQASKRFFPAAVLARTRIARDPDGQALLFQQRPQLAGLKV